MTGTTVEELAAFKEYCHKRMDDAGVPTHPAGEHSAAGCRIGDRFDILIGERDRLAAALQPFAECCEHIADDEDPEEWAKFRLLVKHYRAARAALDQPT